MPRGVHTRDVGDTLLLNENTFRALATPKIKAFLHSRTSQRFTGGFAAMILRCIQASRRTNGTIRRSSGHSRHAGFTTLHSVPSAIDYGASMARSSAFAAFACSPARKSRRAR